MGNCNCSIKKDINSVYIITDELGRGSFGIVNKAIHRSTHEVYAVKRIDKKHLKKKDIENVNKEIQIMAKIDNPHCVKMFEIYESQDSMHIVMELLEGGELFDRILQFKYFNEETAINVFKQLVVGVQYLHSIGISHRDLKPENLIYREEGEDSQIVITDFGLARHKDPKKNFKMFTECGSAHYMAPEIINDADYDKRIDIWSLGVILFIMLCGYFPFDGANVPEIFRRISKCNYEFPETPPLSEEAKDVVERCLRVDPSERITTQQILSHRWITGEEVSKIQFQSDYSLRFTQTVARTRLRRGILGVLALSKLRLMDRLNTERSLTNMSLTSSEASSSEEKMTIDDFLNEIHKAEMEKHCTKEELKEVEQNVEEQMEKLKSSKKGYNPLDNAFKVAHDLRVAMTVDRARKLFKSFSSKHLLPKGKKQKPKKSMTAIQKKIDRPLSKSTKRRLTSIMSFIKES